MDIKALKEAVSKNFKAILDSDVEDAFKGFLRNTVRKLEAITNALEKILSEKAIDFEKAYERIVNAKNKSFEAIKDFFRKEKETDTDTNTQENKENRIKGILKSSYKYFKEKMVGPPEESIEKKFNLLDSIANKVMKFYTETIPSAATSIGKNFVSMLSNSLTSVLSGTFSFIKEKGPSIVGNVASGVGGLAKDAFYTFANNFLPEKLKLTNKANDTIQEIEERSRKRKKEIEEEKRKAKEEKEKKEDSSSFLGRLLSGLAGLLKNTVSGIVSGITGFLGNTFLKLFTKAIPWGTIGIGKTLQKGAGELLKKGTSLASKAARLGARGLISGARIGLGLLGRVGATLALGLSNPIGWVTLAATAAYAGYKLYKHYKRGAPFDDYYGSLLRLRLMMYGFSEKHNEYFNKIFDLDMLMRDYIKYDKYKVVFKEFDDEFTEKLYEIFEVKADEEIEKTEILKFWFINRYLPSLKVFLEGIYRIKPIYLDDIEKLDKKEIYRFLLELRIPNSIYQVKTLDPVIEEPRELATKEMVDELKNTITKNLKEELDQKERTQVEKEYGEKKPTDTQFKPIVKEKSIKPNLIKPDVSENIRINQERLAENAEGETSDKGVNVNQRLAPDTKTIKEATSSKLAPGPLVTDNNQLEGIVSKVGMEKVKALDPNLLTLLSGMAKEYKEKTGKDLIINEAYRSTEDQQKLYDKYVRGEGPPAAKPGRSLHEYGLAVDIPGEIADELESLGLLKKYGFTRPIAGERWHLEPIGVSVDPKRAKEDPSFRTVAILSSPGRGGGGLATLSSNIREGGRDLALQEEIYKRNKDSQITFTQIQKELASKEAPQDNRALINKNIEEFDNKDKYTSVTFATKDIRSRDTDVMSKKRLEFITDEPPVDSAKNTNIASGPIDKDINNILSYEHNTTNKAPVDTIKENANKVQTGNVYKVPVTFSDANKTNNNLDLTQYTNLSPEVVIKQAAKMAGVDESVLLKFAQIESGLRPNARAQTSTASGLFQLTDSTWDYLVRKYGAKYNIPVTADKDNPLYNSLMAAEYVKENLSRLDGYKDLGIDDVTAAYLAHHYGARGAKNLINHLRENPNAKIPDIVPEKVYRANRQELQNHTVNSYIQKVSYKLGQEYRPRTQTSSVELEQRPTILRDVGGYTGSISKSQPIAKASLEASSSTQIPTINLDKVEAILERQYDKLAEAVQILSEINSKFNLENMKNIIPQPSPYQHVYKSGKAQNSIDLSKKPLPSERI